MLPLNPGVYLTDFHSIALKFALDVTLEYSNTRPTLVSIACAVPENVIATVSLVNIILPSLDNPTTFSEAAVIWLANSNAEGLEDVVLLYVPAVIPISERGFPAILEQTMLFSELVILTCLSALTAATVEPWNT